MKRFDPERRSREFLEQQRKLWKELDPPISYWEHFKGLLMVILLLAVFTAPLWVQALEWNMP